MSPDTVALLAGAGLLAGGVNAIAGGGSLLSFPALLAAGYPAVTANVTNTVALVPGYAGSVAGSRGGLTGQGDRVRRLGATSVVGAVLGSVLLLTTPSEVFRAVVPFLILLGCALLLAQPRLARRVQEGSGRHSTALLQAGVLLGSTYGAYFGAGLGVVLLGLLGVFLDERLARVNALKNVLSTVVPFLILLGCALLLAQPRLARRVQEGSGRHSTALLQAGVLLASTYGAYFGAGLGVVLLGLLGVFLDERLARVNALKNVLSTVVNVVALVAFGLFGPVAWEAVLVVAVASLVGGYAGGRVAGRIPSAVLRAVVVAYGVVVAVVLLVQG